MIKNLFRPNLVEVIGRVHLDGGKIFGVKLCLKLDNQVVLPKPCT